MRSVVKNTPKNFNRALNEFAKKVVWHVKKKYGIEHSKQEELRLISLIVADIENAIVTLFDDIEKTVVGVLLMDPIVKKHLGKNLVVSMGGDRFGVDNEDCRGDATILEVMKKKARKDNVNAKGSKLFDAIKDYANTNLMIFDKDIVKLIINMAYEKICFIENYEERFDKILKEIGKETFSIIFPHMVLRVCPGVDEEFLSFISGGENTEPMNERLLSVLVNAKPEYKN